MHSSELPNQIADQVSDAVVTAGSNAYCYDQNGNMRRRTIGGVVYTLTYDAENRLVSVSGVATASFTYDADGNRVKSVLNGETVIYVGNLYEKKVVGSTTTHTKYYYFGGRRIAVRVAGTLSWLLSDHLGSTTVTADGATGARTAELWYKPWGESRGAAFGVTPTQRRFTGQTLDGVAGGLYFYNARYYDPALGRFTQADTIVPEPGNPQSLNRYSYVGNRPLGFVDPSGYAACAAGDMACWQNEWRWKDRWYKAHGHTGGDWFGIPGDPEFENDEQILRDTVGEAGVVIEGSWDFATQLVPLATGIVRFGNRLSGGLAQLRGLLGGGAVVQSGSCFGRPCALPPGTDTVHIPNAIHDAAWLMHTVVHELAHIIDWHSNIQVGTITTYGQMAPVYGRFSSAWGEAPLTKYAAGIEVGVRPYPDAWDVWAEAVTVWVFGLEYDPRSRMPNISAADLANQMTRLSEILNGWR